MRKTIYNLFPAFVLLSASHVAIARDFVLAVGSSTVYPFAVTAAERIGKTTRFRTPKVEAWGSGGGFKLFCKGSGADEPDIALASREITTVELERCRANEVGGITAIRFGYDGIVFASASNGPRFSLTLTEIYRALASHVPDPAGGNRLVANPYERWKQINPRLPDIPIRLYGPPITSGTRDVLVERALEPGCRSFGWLAEAHRSRPQEYQRACQTIREDGVYISTGENDNLIVRKLIDSTQSLGILGFSFFDQNRDQLQAADINGVGPDFESLYDQRYPLVRSLFVYVKVKHIGWIPGLGTFLSEMVSERAAGENGYLVDRGLVPLPEKERRANAAKVRALGGN